MKRIVILLIVALLGQWMYAKDYQVSGPQGGLAMTLTLPDGFDTATDSCPLVILMHGIFSSKNFTPMPKIAKQLAKAGIASIRFDFGGHWSSEGEMQLMTIEKEIADALGGLPEVKLHCSVLAEEALHEAIKNYKERLEAGEISE